MRILDGEVCSRVYSYLGLERAMRYGPGAGAGAGMLCGRRAWTPLGDSGLVYMGCTDTAAYPTAVTFPADPTGNGGFEAGNPPTGWTAGTCTFTSENGTRTDGSGAKVARLAYNGVNAVGVAYQLNKLTVGNRYSFDCWMLGANGAVPAISDGNVTIWTGAGTGAWEHATGTFTAANTYIEPYCANLAATRYVDCDDFTYACLNSSSLTDFSGLGHHLAQATASKQPLWVASGSGGLLRTDGVARYMTGSWAQSRPTHVFYLAKYTKAAAVRYLFDGGVAQHGALYYDNTVDKVRTYGGADGPDTSFSDTTPYLFDVVFDATNQKLGVNGAALASGAGATVEPGGFTFGGWANGGLYTAQDVYGIVIYNRALSEPERQRVIRWMTRLGKKLAVL